MGILSRIGTLVKSSLYDPIFGVDSKSRQGLEPLELRRQVELRKSIAIRIADVMNLQKRHIAELIKAQDWGRKASAARRAGDEYLTLQAQSREQEHTVRAEKLLKQWQIQKQVVEGLKEALRLAQVTEKEAARG